MFTFIIGGSASGKSEYAEQHVLSLSGGRVYIATLEPWDDECRKRILKHQNARARRGFQTIECYRGLDRLTVPEGSNILLDGLGNLVAGELYSPEGQGTEAILVGVEHLLGRCGHPDHRCRRSILRRQGLRGRHPALSPGDGAAPL